MASQITSLTVVYSTVYSDADQRKHQRSAPLAFVWGIHRDRWIPRTKGQLRGKCFHLMTSSWHPLFLGVVISSCISYSNDAFANRRCIWNLVQYYIIYSIMMLMKFADLSQSDRSNWVMCQVKDPCPGAGWDGCLTRGKAFVKVNKMDNSK